MDSNLGSEILHTGFAIGHRFANLHPDGKFTGSGGSPGIRIRFCSARLVRFTVGTAERLSLIHI